MNNKAEREGLRNRSAKWTWETLHARKVELEAQVEQLIEDKIRLINLLQELKANEYPRGYLTHPTPRGRLLWHQVEMEILSGGGN